MANTVYSNKVIEAKAKDILTTAINARSMMTVDDSLAENAGMIKTLFCIIRIILVEEFLIYVLILPGILINQMRLLYI